MNLEYENRRHSVIQELCGAVSVLWRKKIGPHLAADCFCGTNPTAAKPEWPFNFDDEVLDLVKEAIAEKAGLTLEELNREMENSQPAGNPNKEGSL